MTRPEDTFPLTAIAVILAATVLWWAFALWPLPSEAPEWLERARYVCFNSTGTGLPDRSGWILLIGQPLGMVALLMAGWGERTSGAMRRLRATASGRVAFGSTLALLVVGLGAAGVRVATAGTPAPVIPGGADVPDTYPRLDRPWPGAQGLVDQRGESFSLGRLEGRPALVTFAFAHCGDICPMVVHASRMARDEFTGQAGVRAVGDPQPPPPARDLALVVITLDPWRDTPSQLPRMTEQWELEEDDFVLSGEIGDVESALDAWNVARERVETTGDIVHPPLVYLVEEDGTIAYASTGSKGQLLTLLARLD